MIISATISHHFSRHLYRWVFDFCSAISIGDSLSPDNAAPIVRVPDPRRRPQHEQSDHPHSMTGRSLHTENGAATCPISLQSNAPLRSFTTPCHPAPTPVPRIRPSVISCPRPRKHSLEGQMHVHRFYRQCRQQFGREYHAQSCDLLQVNSQ